MLCLRVAYPDNPLPLSLMHGVGRFKIYLLGMAWESCPVLFHSSHMCASGDEAAGAAARRDASSHCAGRLSLLEDVSIALSDALGCPYDSDRDVHGSNKHPPPPTMAPWSMGSCRIRHKNNVRVAL